MWKFKNLKDFEVENPTDISPENQRVADLALFSFLKVLAKINKLSHILDYRKNADLNARMPGY